MDTIVYFYKKRGLQTPETEPVGLKTYMLVRVALDVGKDEWFGEKLGMPDSCRGETAEVTPDAVPEGITYCRGRRKSRPEGLKEKEPKGCQESWKSRPEGLKEKEPKGCQEGQKSRLGNRIWKRWRKACSSIVKAAGPGEETGESGAGGRMLWFPGRCRERRLRQEESLQQEEITAERERRIRNAAASIKKLAGQVEELAGEGSSSYCVYENSIRKALVGESGDDWGTGAGAETEGEQENGTDTKGGGSRPVLPVLWRRYFGWKEFADYSGRFWVEQLMPEAVLPHFVILGTAACIPEVIEKYACRMKSLKWILPEAGCTEELQGFVEDFYVESGLAISLQILPDAGEFRKLRQICVLPSNILDFTGESGISISGAAKGSIWLDMCSQEEKRRRILVRGADISCFSMKEKWKYAQRRCKSPVLP